MRTKRPIEFYILAWESFTKDARPIWRYQKALDAFALAGDAFELPLSGCMTTKQYALSYMMDDVWRKVKDDL
jgi:hypothetical protein